MATPERGPIKIDLTGTDGKKKLDVEWNEFAQKYVVKVRGGKRPTLLSYRPNIFSFEVGPLTLRYHRTKISRN